MTLKEYDEKRDVFTEADWRGEMTMTIKLGKSHCAVSKSQFGPWWAVRIRTRGNVRIYFNVEPKAGRSIRQAVFNEINLMCNRDGRRRQSFGL